MPEVRYYTVTQEREVKVWANSPVDAAQIANAAFNNEITSDNPLLLPGSVRTPVRERSLDVREDY